MRRDAKTNNVDVLLCISYLLELLVWVLSFNAILDKKYSKHLYYVLFAIGDLLITVFKQYNAVNASLITIIMFSYMIFFVCLLYKERIIVKISIVAGMFLLSLLADLIVVAMGILLGYTMEEMSSGIVNSIASIGSKIVLFLIVRIVFYKRIKKDNFVKYNELVVLMCSTVICEAPCALLFKKMSMIENNDNLLIFFMAGQIIMLSISVYISIMLAKRRNSERELQLRIQKIEVELQSGKNSAEILAFKHDIKNHLFIVQNLLEKGEIEQAKYYLKRINRIPKLSKGETIILKNKSMEIILNQKRMEALRKGFTFNPNIMTNVHHIDDIDLCSILANLLDNAIEASTKDGYINLTIKDDKDFNGTLIECTNTYENKLNVVKGNFVSSKTGEGHGLGIKIVRRIAEKYNGTAKFSADEEWFYAKVYIPGGEE